MAAIDQLIELNITQETTAVDQASFAIPLIVGPTNAGWATGDNVHTYFSASAMLADGFKSTSPEYLYAQTLMSQSITPTQFLVGRRSAAVTSGSTTTNAIANTLQTISAQNDSWYCLLLAGANDADIQAAATYIESTQKIFIAFSSEAAVAASGTGDIGSTLQNGAFNRTALFYSAANASGGPEAGWVGGQLPQTPGSNTWAFKTISGVQADSLSATQQATLFGSPINGTQGKSVNVMQTVGGVNITQMGTMASGRFIDQTIGVDWLYSQIQSNVFSNLVNLAKIPYTDKGVAVLLSAVRSALDLGVTNGLIDGKSAISISAPLVSSVPESQRAARIAPTITFSCRLAGALHAAIINGTVTV